MELKDDLEGDVDTFGSLPAILERVWTECRKLTKYSNRLSVANRLSTHPALWIRSWFYNGCNVR